jgi:acetyl-CoA carboxylase biotin carboxyl carrier protein
MNQKELKELIDFLIEKDITEFELERGDVKVKIKRGETHAAQPVIVHGAPMMMPAAAPVSMAAAASSVPAAPSAASPVTPSAEDADKELFIVKSPIVGTFYEAPSPGSPPFVKPGDHVDVGQVLCIIEAMKLMNEIEAEANGELVKRFVTNGQPVEYGQPLFGIRQQK